MKKYICIFFILFACLNFYPPANATSKYLSYTTKIEPFSTKRINKNYQKKIIEIQNISSIPMKFIWSQEKDYISAQQVYSSTQYITTLGSQIVAFLGGATIIGFPFAVHGAVEMVNHKNALLLEEINNYVLQGDSKYEYILKPQEKMQINLIESKTQKNPASIKLRFSGNNGKIIEEIECK